MSIKTFWKASIPNKLLIIFPLIWITLAVFFTFYDLTISKFLFDSNSLVGNFVESFGEIPGILFALFAIFTLGTNLNIKNKNYKKLFFLGEVLISTGLILYLIRLFFNYFNFSFHFISLNGLTLGLSAILVSLLLFYLMKTKFSKFSEKNNSFAKLSVILLFISGFIVEVLKFMWGRVRFRDLQEGITSFTSWYLPQGLTGSQSFPSGHAFLGWILIPLFLLFLNKNELKKWIFLILTIIFGMFVSYERIVVGAHYASDVLFSWGIVTITFLILYNRYFPKKKIFPTMKKKKSKKRN